MISTFTVAAEAVGATVKHFTDLDDVAGYLQDLTANRLVASSSLSSRLAAMIETITPLPPKGLPMPKWVSARRTPVLPKPAACCWN